MSLSSSDNTELNVINYIPQSLEEERPTNVKDFVATQTVDGDTNFLIDPEVSNQIGLSESKKLDYKKKFDAEVFRYVQKIKDGAYKEAFEQGLADGIAKAQAEAFSEAKETIENQLTTIKSLITELQQYREKVYESNKKEIIALCFHLVEKMVYKEIEKDPKFILDAVSELIKAQNKKETLTIHLSPLDYQFVQENMSSLGPDLEIQRCFWEEDSNLNRGDIIIQNSKGLWDGTIHSRLERLKSILGDFN